MRVGLPCLRHPFQATLLQPALPTEKNTSQSSGAISSSSPLNEHEAPIPRSYFGLLIRQTISCPEDGQHLFAQTTSTHVPQKSLPAKAALTVFVAVENVMGRMGRKFSLGQVVSACFEVIKVDERNLPICRLQRRALAKDEKGSLFFPASGR